MEMRNAPCVFGKEELFFFSADNLLVFAERDVLIPYVLEIYSNMFKL